MKFANSGHKKAPTRIGASGLWKVMFASLAAAAELVLELLHTSGGVDETLFTGVNRVGIHGDVPHDDKILNAIDSLLTVRLDSGLREKILASRNVAEAYRIQLWMYLFLHDAVSFRK